MSSLLRAPASFLWDLGSGIHRKLYDSAVLPRQTLPKPVISIGNWTMGGTGKTPFADWLIDLAKKQNKKVAVLSRGYGRRNKLTEEVLTTSKAEDVGDEPLLLKLHHPDVPVFVGRSRYAAGMKALEGYQPDFFILDDGFQHHQLARKTDIVLVDATQSPRKHKVFPLGWARESADCLIHADWIVHTKTNLISVQELDYRKQWLESIAEPSVPVLSAEYQMLGYFDSRDNSIQTNIEHKVVALAGIARPEVFFQSVKQDFQVIESISYADHQVYTKATAEDILNKLKQHQVMGLVVTEKDWVKLKEFNELNEHLIVMKRKVTMKGSEGYSAFCQQIFA